MEKKTITLITLILISIIYVENKAEVSYYPMSKSKKIMWAPESLFVGADLVSNGNNIEVSLISTLPVSPLGALYVIIPAKSDSSIYLFNNKDSHATVANLGPIDAGNMLIFKYKIIDSAECFSPIKGNIYYSGQNRKGIDTFISDNVNGMFNYRWSIAGQVDSNTVEMGFEIVPTHVFSDIVVTIKGVKLKR